MSAPPKDKDVWNAVTKKVPGEEKQGRGSHRHWVRRVEGAKRRKITVARQGIVLPRNTWDAICEQAGLPRHKMRELVKCTLTKEQYIDHVKETDPL